MKLSAALLAATLSFCATAHSSPAAAADPVFLTCEFDVRSIGGLVLFKRLKKLRIWYGDGGGEEWTGVDYSKGDIATKVEGGRSMTLSRDFRDVTFNDTDGSEHAKGHCKIASTKGRPAYWFATKLRQH